MRRSKEMSLITGNKGIIPEKNRQFSNIKVNKNIDNIVSNSNEKSAERYSKKRMSFREKDLIKQFHNYSLMSSEKAKDIHIYSGKNLIQETTKNIAKELVSEIKNNIEKQEKVGTQENETQILIDYYNNK